MIAKRKRHKADFKARVALEALKGTKTMNELAAEFDLAPSQISDWKALLAKNAVAAFSPGAAATDAAEQFEKERIQLHAKIGKQAIELDWLTKKSKQLGL